MTATLTAAFPVRTADASAIDWHRLRRAAHFVVVLTMVVLGAVLLVRQAPMLGRGIASVANAHLAGLVLTGVLGAVTYVAAAVAMTAASGRSLPLRRTTATQLAAACTNRVTPAGIGGMATNIQYLERDGATRAEAVTAIGITSLASFVVHVSATLAALVVLGGPIGAPALALPAALALGAAGSIAVVARRSQRLRSWLASSLREARSAAAAVCADRRRLGLLLVGTLGVTFGHGLAFAAAVSACGSHLPILRTLAVFLAGSAVGSASPTPGGLGTLEAALVAGLAGVGAATAPAIAGVLAYRLITYWLPIIPGALALHLLRPKSLART